MKIALCGNEAEEWMEQKKKLEMHFQKMGQMVQIDYYPTKQKLYDNLILYDMVCLTQNFVKQMGLYIEQKENPPVVFATGKTILSFQENEIFYIEANLKVIHIRGREGDIELRFSISEAEELLEGRDFIKIHRSYIVNAAYIESIVGNTLILKDRTRLPISKYRMEEVRQKYLSYLGNSDSNLYV